MLLTLLLAASPLAAQQINYQGRLTDANGNAVPDGQYTLRFDIYDAATGGTRLWGTQTNVADLVQGRFNVVLGPTAPTGGSLVNVFPGGLRYLQITVGPNAPITPRQQMLAAPVALHALVSDTVTNGAIGTAQLADGSVTAAKIAGDTGVWTGSGGNIYRLNGNVGIGTTAPAAKLDVVGSVTFSGSGTFSGNVGIGSASAPGAPLHVRRSPGGMLAAKLESTDTQGVRLILDPSTPGGHIWGLDATANGNPTGSGMFAIYDATAGFYRMVFDGTGNVGIGTSYPQAKLDVAGDIKANNKSVVVGEENLRIVRGAIPYETSTNGPLANGYSWTQFGGNVGYIDITFSPAFTGNPVITATARVRAAGGVDAIVVMIDPTAITPSFCRLTVRGTDGGAGPRRDFHFIAIGPR
jgi:hypothetical protein